MHVFGTIQTLKPKYRLDLKYVLEQRYRLEIYLHIYTFIKASPIWCLSEICYLSFSHRKDSNVLRNTDCGSENTFCVIQSFCNGVTNCCS